MSEQTNSLVDVYRPAHHIQDRLDERGWTRTDLAQASGLRPAEIAGIIDGGAPVTTSIAIRLATAFSGNPATWLALQKLYDDAMGDTMGDTTRRTDDER